MSLTHYRKRNHNESKIYFNYSVCVYIFLNVNMYNATVADMVSPCSWSTMRVVRFPSISSS